MPIGSVASSNRPGTGLSSILYVLGEAPEPLAVEAPHALSEKGRGARGGSAGESYTLREHKDPLRDKNPREKREFLGPKDRVVQGRFFLARR